MVASLVHRLETELQGVRSWCGTTLGYGRTRICTQTVRLGPGRDSSPSLGAGLHGSSPHLPAPFLLHTHPRPFAHTTLLLEARWAAPPPSGQEDTAAQLPWPRPRSNPWGREIWQEPCRAARWVPALPSTLDLELSRPLSDTRG